MKLHELRDNPGATKTKNVWAVARVRARVRPPDAVSKVKSPAQVWR